MRSSGMVRSFYCFCPPFDEFLLLKAVPRVLSRGFIFDGWSSSVLLTCPIAQETSVGDEEKELRDIEKRVE